MRLGDLQVGKVAARKLEIAMRVFQLKMPVLSDTPSYTRTCIIGGIDLHGAVIAQRVRPDLRPGAAKIRIRSASCSRIARQPCGKGMEGNIVALETLTPAPYLRHGPWRCFPSREFASGANVDAGPTGVRGFWISYQRTPPLWWFAATEWFTTGTGGRRSCGTPAVHQPVSQESSFVVVPDCALSRGSVAQR